MDGNEGKDFMKDDSSKIKWKSVAEHVTYQDEDAKMEEQDKPNE